MTTIWSGDEGNCSIHYTLTKNQAMNETEQFTTEFFENEGRKRKQIPLAVFAIIAVHVVLFIGLLGASGCKKKTEATATEGTAAKKFAAEEYSGQKSSATPSHTTTAPVPAPAEPVKKKITPPEYEITEATEMARREKP